MNRRIFILKAEFDQHIDEYMIYCRSRQLRPKTMLSYERTLRLFERWCRDEMEIDSLDDVTENVIRRYITDIQQRGKYTFYADESRKALNTPEHRRDYCEAVSITTVNNYLRNLKAFFNWLEDQHILLHNPVRKIRLLKNERKAKEYMDDTEFRKLINSFNKADFPEHRDYAITMLLMDSGMRLGECSCLLVSDVDLLNRTISLSAEITKGRKDRTVFFSPKTETILRRWINYKDRYVESDYLFPMKHNGKHITISTFERNFRGYLKRVSIKSKYSPHCLRNNFAKRCLMNGMDIYTLSRILGHSSVTVTEKAYLDLTDADLGKRYQNFSPVSNII